MTHLRIELNNIQENVSSAVIKKLYELATSGDLDLNSNLAGNLHTTATYLEYIDALCKTLLNPSGMFPDLTISATDIYIMFEDSEVLNVLLANNIGDGVGVTIALAANANLGSIFYQNTTITSFDNFDKFTYANSHETSFRGCTNLRSINLLNNTVLAQEGFGGCTSLTSVNIGGGNGSRYGVFNGCTSLLSVTLPSSYTTLREKFFQGCSNLTTINLSNILTLYQYAFIGCSKLTTADLSSCTNIGYETFSGCTKLATVTLSPLLTSIGLGTFKDCSSLSSIDLSHITSIGGSHNYGAFQGCSSLTSITLNSAITSIPTHCFYGCSLLASISGLSNVTTLGTNSLRGCSSLTTHDLDFSKIISYGGSCFYDTPITVPAADLLHVLTVSSWGLNHNKITGTSLVLDSITSIGLNSFSDNSTLTSLTISSLLILSIEYTAFEDCTNLTTIDLSGSSITALNRGIFSGCNVTIAKLPLTLRRLGEPSSANALGNKRLTEIRGLDNITELYNSSLTNISHAIYHGSLQQSKMFISRCSSDSGESSRHSYLNLYYLPSFRRSSLVQYYNYYGRVDSTLAGYRVNDSNSDTTINLIYFKELENINHFMFYGARFKSFVINKNTPPTVDDTGIYFENNLSEVANSSQWSTSIFGTIPTSGNNAMIIYVPDAAVSTYQADSNYNSYTIRGINEVDPNTNLPYLTRYATNALWEAAGKPEDALIEEYM